MTSVCGFEQDPYRTVLDTEVVSSGVDDGRPFVVLADTILFPEGGGQPADRGLVAGVEVSDVQRRGTEIRHYLARPVPAGLVRVELDWPRRFDHMQQHTAQHLLTAIAQDRFGWPTTAFHLGGEVSDVELDTPSLAAGDLRRLEDAVAVEIRAGRRVTTRRVEPNALADLPVRTRGLPAGHAGAVRLVEIEGVDLNTCGGTHVRSTSEIEAVCLLGTEPMRGGTRVFFVAGGRVRGRMARHEERSAALRRLLGAGDDELVAVLAQRLEAERDLQHRARALEDLLAGSLAAELAVRPEPAVEMHFDEASGAFLQRIAREATRRAPAKVVLLTAATPSGPLFCLAAGDQAPCDLPSLGREVARLLDGRGGGAGRLFQGKASSLAHRDAAVDLVRKSLG